MRTAMPDGRSRAQHLAEVAEKLPDARAALVPPPVDPADAWLLPAFDALEASRAVGLGGPRPLAWGEVESWLRVTGTPVTHEEVVTLRAMDQATLAHAHAAMQAGAS
jgi:hypothetical protein